ncbi:MAG: hypothetical protein ACR2FY_07910 [Pirellulaceae bacterium]
MRTMSHLATTVNRLHSQVRLSYFLVVLLAVVFGVTTSSADELADGSPIDDVENYFADPEVDLVDFQQPGSTVRPPSAVRRPSRRPVTGQELAPPSVSDTGDYLASAPRMFGHYYGASGQLLVRAVSDNGLSGKNFVTDIPLGGGAGPLQISDNNTPVPQSRWFFNFNHFENAIQTRDGNRQVSSPVDQYTLGTEQTFMDGISSWQLQLPLTSGFDFDGNPGASSAGFGNLGFISKTAIWRSDYAILSGGLGLELPTGSSVQGRGPSTRYQLRNSSTTVLPFIGVMALPTDATFFQAFFTASVPASGNQFVVGSPGGPDVNAGVYTPQTRLHLDLAGGAWFYQNPGGGGITGMAFVGEVHYVAATQPGDFLNVTSIGPAGPNFYQLGNLSNKQTTTNLTVGIHTIWNDRFQFRIGGAFPLAQRPNRGFDAEVIAQVNFIP